LWRRSGDDLERTTLVPDHAGAPVSWLGWRLLQVVLAFLAALVLPAAALIVVTGLLRTGLPGVVAVSAWAVATVLLIRAVLRRRRMG